MPTDHEFITPPEKTQCQVHLTSEQLQGDLQQCSHTKESRIKSHIPTEKVYSWHIEQFEEKMKLYPDSLNRRMLRDQPLKNKEIIYSQTPKSEVLKQECRADFLDCSIRELQRQILPILDMKRLEESRPDSTKNWRSEKEHFEKLMLKVFTRWKN